jgi:hypothetical protein
LNEIALLEGEILGMYEVLNKKDPFSGVFSTTGSGFLWL